MVYEWAFRRRLYLLGMDFAPRFISLGGYIALRRRGVWAFRPMSVRRVRDPFASCANEPSLTNASQASSMRRSGRNTKRSTMHTLIATFASRSAASDRASLSWPLPRCSVNCWRTRKAAARPASSSHARTRTPRINTAHHRGHPQPQRQQRSSPRSHQRQRVSRHLCVPNLSGQFSW